MKMPNISPLKAMGWALAFAGMVISSELQRRETDEFVTKKVDEKLAEMRLIADANAVAESQKARSAGNFSR